MTTAHTIKIHNQPGFQHKFNDIISAVTHLHLNDDNCLESIMIRGETKRMRELANELSNNRGIKSLKFHFVNIV